MPADAGQRRAPSVSGGCTCIPCRSPDAPACSRQPPPPSPRRGSRPHQKSHLDCHDGAVGACTAGAGTAGGRHGRSPAECRMPAQATAAALQVARDLDPASRAHAHLARCLDPHTPKRRSCLQAPGRGGARAARRGKLRRHPVPRSGQRTAAAALPLPRRTSRTPAPATSRSQAELLAQPPARLRPQHSQQPLPQPPPSHPPPTEPPASAPPASAALTHVRQRTLSCVACVGEAPAVDHPRPVDRPLRHAVAGLGAAGAKDRKGGIIRKKPKKTRPTPG